MARKGKPTQGSKKIEIKKVESEEARHVCFSKRRIGVFTKASELATMSGAQVAVVVDPPSGTPYSFGSPSVDSVVNSFLNQSPITPLNSTQAYVINKLNKDNMKASEKLAVENQRKVMLDEKAKEASKHKEFELIQNTNQLGLDHLNQLLASYTRARNSLTERTNFLKSQTPSITANMGLVDSMPGNFPGIFGAMAKSAPAPTLVSSSGVIVGPMNCAPNPSYTPGSL